MTRTPAKAEALRRLGATPVVCDVYVLDALQAAAAAFRPDVLVHQLTDLPDDPGRLPEYVVANRRIRTEGTRNLLAAAASAGVFRVLAQSIAWALDSVEEHERLVLEANGVVLRYGQLYGPGTYFEHELPPRPRIHIDDAARRTVAALDAPPRTIQLLVGDQ